MKVLRLVLLIACCGLLARTSFSQNCPPDSAYPNPDIVSSFSPDSSCIDSSRGQPSTGDDKHDCILACEHSYTTYCTMANAGSTYSWTVTGGVIVGSSTGNCVTVLWGPTGSGSISVTETNAAGCSATKERCVKIIDTPIAAFTVPSTVCKNVPLNFINQSQNAIGYSWDFGDGNTSTLDNPTHAYTIPGPHTVTLVAYNKCGCSDSATFVVNVSNLDGPVIACPATVCANAQACYSTVSGCSTAVYHWIVNGGTIIGPSNLDHICVLWGAGPQGTVSLFITGCGTVCNDTTTVSVPIISSNGPITGNTVVCPSANEVYTLPLWPGTYYNWTLTGGGTITSGMNTNHIAIHWGLTPGTYTLTATWNNILLGCGGTATMIINVKNTFQMFGLTGPFCIGSQSNFVANDIANWTVTGGTFTGNGTSSITVTWTTGGTQTVTASPLNASLYCNPSASMTVTVANVPPAVAITGPDTICVGGSYQYTATTSGPGYTLLWTVSGGTIVGSATANPVTVQWSGAGSISVQQVQTATPFCTSAPISLPVTVLSIPSITGSTSACMDQTTSFSAGSPHPSLVYTWSIVDGLGNPSPLGSITSGQGTNAISVLWHGPGGTVIVKVSVCSTTLTIPVTINPTPTSTISMSGHVCSPGGSVILTASAGSSYLWSNGANTQSIVVNTAGPYWVRVTNAAGCFDTARIVVPPTQEPVASISTPNSTHYCIPTPPFVDTLYALQGPGYTYVWFPGLQMTPTITVNATGSYYVVVTDANGCSATSNTIVITADSCHGGGGCTPVGTIDFTFPNPACNPVLFNGMTTGGVSNTIWNFGDPTSGVNDTSTLTNPSHTFTHAGWFTVTYGGVDPSSCPISASHPVAIPLAADFSAVVHCDSVFFTDNSTFLPPNSILSWSWSFPGGSPSTSNAQNPAVTYSTPGPHSVTLQVSNALCTVSITKTVTIAPPPSAAFTLPAATCIGTDIALSGSGGSAVSWAWDFGDGATSGLQNTSHAWTTAGPYTVTLTVMDANGCSAVVSHSITINTPTTSCPVTPSNPPPICQGDSVVLTASPGVSYQWQLNAINIPGGTNQTYAALQTGSYTVIVTDAGGCKCTSPPVSVLVNPLPPTTITPSANPVICGSGTLTLTAPAGSYTYLWSTGDTTQSIFLNLNTPGAYTYTVAVKDSNPPNCTATSVPFTVHVYPVPPTPVIAASGPTALCKGDSVTLTSSFPTNNHWSTGATTQSITVHQAGVYTVTVTSNHGCSSSASITVTSSTPDLSLYPFGCDLLCDTVKIPGPIGPFIGYYTYQWFFNGNPIAAPNGNNDTLTPVGSGSYTLILTGPGPTFCKDTSQPYNLSLKDCDSLKCHARICGRKWNDANGNHKLNYGTEFGIPNWKICLVKCNVDNFPTKDTIACTTTDSLGFYCFDNLCAGEYCVVEESRPGWQQTWPMSPPFYHVTLTDSQTVNGVDFGNRKRCIQIWTTLDTIGVPNTPLLTPDVQLPPAEPWPIRIMYQGQLSAPAVEVFEGMITNNIMPIPFCKKGYYQVVREHVTNYKFDRIYVNDSLRSDNGDSILVSLSDSTDGATVVMLNVYQPDTTVRFRTFTADQLAASDQGKPMKRPRPKKTGPMPNTANVIDEMLRQGGVLIAGLQGQVNTNNHIKGYVYPANQSDVFKTFDYHGVTHTGAPHGLDRDLKDNLILNRQKYVPATKHNNKFLANLLALKINILASDYGKTPPGFGDLLYSPPSPTPWLVEGQEYSVRLIAAMADSLLTNWEGITYQQYDDFNAIVESLNVAFAGTLPFGPGDTATWVTGGKLKLTGARALSEVPYLLNVGGMAPATRAVSYGAKPLPESFSLGDCYPNPFNPMTTIRYSLPTDAKVVLTVYDVLGRRMAVLADGVQEAGIRQATWNANNFASGIYFYRLEAVSVNNPGESFSQVKKMLLLK